jgi:hypothetical protein
MIINLISSPRLVGLPFLLQGLFTLVAQPLMADRASTKSHEFSTTIIWACSALVGTSCLVYAIAADPWGGPQAVADIDKAVDHLDAGSAGDIAGKSGTESGADTSVSNSSDNVDAATAADKAIDNAMDKARLEAIATANHMSFVVLLLSRAALGILGASWTLLKILCLRITSKSGYVSIASWIYVSAVLGIGGGPVLSSLNEQSK